jgi:hypothetical protein
MPTSSVMALTAVPCSPVWEKCSTAASTSASRRSGAVWRVRVEDFVAMDLTAYLVVANFSTS